MSKTILSFEFDTYEDEERFEIVANATKTHSNLKEFEDWLRNKYKHGFEKHEIPVLDDKTAEDAESIMFAALQLVRDKFFDCMNQG